MYACVKVTIILSFLRYVAQNSIQCNCSNVWMKNFLPLHAPGTQPVVCAGPGSLAGRRIDDIPLETLECSKQADNCRLINCSHVSNEDNVSHAWQLCLGSVTP